MELQYGPLSQDQDPRCLEASSTLCDCEDEPTARRVSVPRTGQVLATAGRVLATGLVMGCVAWFASSRLSGQPLPRLPGGAELEVKQAAESTWVQGADFPSHAPPMEIDVEYQADPTLWGTNYDHIPDPEMCAAMCQGVKQCQAWTWVKDAGLDGNPSQCWLKGGVGTKAPKAGLVSGTIPPRRQFQSAPAKEAGGGAGSLFCWSLMVPGTDEIKLLQWQYENKASIFACDKARVYSNQVITIADDVVSKVVNSTLKCEYGGDSQSALNSWIFIACWYKIIEDKEYRMYDWVVKADPDCVFFPDRLSRILAQYPKEGYINNCKYGMHGPIEVFSRVAIDYLAQDYAGSWDGRAPKRCVTEQDFGQWGEDMFLDQCLGTVLGISPKPLQPKLMCEAHCDCPSWYWCEEGNDVVSYHPFKSVESYSNCMANALGGPLVAAASTRLLKVQK